MTLSTSPNFLPQFTHPYYGGGNCAHFLELIDAQCFNTVNVQYRLTIAYCVNVIVVISILIEKKSWTLNKNRKWNDWNVNGVRTSPLWVTCWCAKGTQSQRTIMVSISGIFIFYLKILEEIIFLLKHLHIQWDWMQHFAWFFNNNNKKHKSSKTFGLPATLRGRVGTACFLLLLSVFCCFGENVCKFQTIYSSAIYLKLV